MLQWNAQDDCFSNFRQAFLVCTTIHRAHHLGVFTGETAVRVTIGKLQKSTKSSPFSENPYFNEYFVFELRCTLNELLRQTILFEVRKRSLCRKSTTLGELVIDLQSVWNQPNRCFFKKWGRLEQPVSQVGINSKQKCYLQIDLAIVTESTNTDVMMREAEQQNMLQWELNTDFEDINKNLLTSNSAQMECNIRYSVFFYRGVFLKKSDYYIEFTFHPFKGKTAVCKSTSQPEFNEMINFCWTYPSLAQTFNIQIYSHEHLQWKSIAEYDIFFNEIAFKDKPQLGPTFLHLYDASNTNNYVGRLLLEIRSECLTEKIFTSELGVGRTLSIDVNRWWHDEKFDIEFLPVYGDFIHGSFSNCKITMKLAEHNSNQVECFLKPYNCNNKSVAKLRYFRQETPYKVITITAELPDTRLKYDSDFFLHELTDFMKSEYEVLKLFRLKYINQYEMHNKCLKSIIISLLAKIKEGGYKKRLEFASFREPTPWDTNRLMYLQDFMKTLPEQLYAMLQRLKNTNKYNIELTMDDVMQQLVSRYRELMNLHCFTRVQDDWPDLILLLSTGNREVGACRVNSKSFLNTPKDRDISPSNICWDVRHFVFKDTRCRHTCLNCGCVAAIVQGCISIVAVNERRSFLEEIAFQWQQTESFYYNPIVPYTTFKCRLFIHQAKIRPGSDRTGLCDSYVRALFAGQSAETPTQQATLSPIWNVVISFERVAMPGPIEWYELNPPIVAIELYDLDRISADEYLGCGLSPVSVTSSMDADLYQFEEPNSSFFKRKSALQRFKELKNISPPPLKWVPILQNGVIRAEVLMAAELIELSNDNELPSKPIVTLGIPMSIRPRMKNFVLEAVFAGFRNYTKGFSGKHRIKILMGDLLLSSGLTSARIKNSINFLVLYASGVVSLPEQLEYWPAIIATDVVATAGDKETTIGAMLIPNSKRYLEREKFITCIAEEANESDTLHTKLQMDTSDRDANLSKPERNSCFQRLWSYFKKKPTRKCVQNTPLLDEDRFTWWTKFYNSVEMHTLDFNYCKHHLVIYNKELEKLPEFSYMHDWAEPISLVHSVKYKKNVVPKEEVYATLKLNLKVTACNCDLGGCGDGATLRPLATALNPEYQAQLQTLADLCKIVVRVYVVQGMQLRSLYRNAQSDSYVRVRLGSRTRSNRAHYIPNQSNPIFGSCFELEGVLPREHLLEVAIYDRNTVQDECIGVTVIDLEDRWRSKHRAIIGLANEYSKTGYNKWRDLWKPSTLLLDLCRKNKIRPPNFVGEVITVDGRTFHDETQIAKDEDLQERLSLTVLKNLEKLPSFGYKLVPEHVETRSLYRPNCPGVEQGKLQLWIELYESNVNIPLPINITPQSPTGYELRVVVLNCADLLQKDTNIFGTRMSDIFVQGWCSDYQQSQSTDVHYRSINGEGKFNWRMVFSFKYCSIEDMMIIKRKTITLESYETKRPPVLYLQLWDNDFLLPDDFLGALEINLGNFPQPYSSRRACKESSITEHSGWRPFGTRKAITDLPEVQSRKSINLFQEKRVSGWFPLRGPYKNSIKDPIPPKLKITKEKSGYAGKIELQLEILTEAEAVNNPVGLGRSAPKALPAPNRPETSFNAVLNPFKTVERIIWPFVRRYVYAVLTVIFAFFLIYATVINLPFIILKFFS